MQKFRVEINDIFVVFVVVVLFSIRVAYHGEPLNIDFSLLFEMGLKHRNRFAKISIKQKQTVLINFPREF